MTKRQKKPPNGAGYPKKFRMKLEKMAEARAERAAFQSEKAEMDSVVEVIFSTLAKDFLSTSSVGRVSVNFDDDLKRMDILYHLDTERLVSYSAVPPPWETAAAASSKDAA